MKEQPNFNDRVNELRFYIKILNKLYKLIILHKDDKNAYSPYGQYLKDVIDKCGQKQDSSTFLVILKSNALMMMYNLIESTVKQQIANVYMSINNDQLNFKQLDNYYKELFKKYAFKGEDGSELESTQRIVDASSELISEILNNRSLEFKINKFKLSGNADLRKIKQIFNEHDISLNHDSISQYGNELLTIKNSRNSLAHGSDTFSNAGSKLTAQEISQYADDVISFLEYLITETDKFIKLKSYKITS
ncbi:hypothetical protein LMB33_10160 [Limosilactobacillus reuteri]|uniref:MAE_28990/MAE_18760 family HEPN-like nuclease n=1 Tax=Limosilactobacillus reuteri TaxID=1598 RepID=UPI001E2C27B1|nr:MAE_28990/MAE_18760 family HEPN-like nuclease [Limosilactobacillus reuteri]MCC4326313.1 hypothetical protein [Limosilactobacillus reuteri]MCC4330732.1 hypothetical protein [Limosilactobacillus reuteri]